MPRLINTCRICGLIRLVSVTTSKLANAPSVTSQYFRRYPSARQRSPIASCLSKGLFQIADANAANCEKVRIILEGELSCIRITYIYNKYNICNRYCKRNPDQKIWEDFTRGICN